MQVPTRRGDKIIRPKIDAHLTPEKYQELVAKRDWLIKVKRPKEAEEVKRLALMGDFSENAGYQLAKSRLRGINQRILDIEDLMRRVEIIEPNQDNSFAQLGHFVTIETNGRTKTYQILGSVETNPTAGVISQSSPLGLALLGRRVGETIEVNLGERVIKYKILKIK